jgi:hypothetical protein
MYLYTKRWTKPVPFNRYSLSWSQAVDQCIKEGRDYCEIHFYRNPETEEIVMTYWEIK